MPVRYDTKLKKHPENEMLFNIYSFKLNYSAFGAAAAAGAAALVAAFSSLAAS